MAVNQHEASLKITAKNDASKTLKGAADDLGRFQDAVKTAGTLLDEHKGSPRAFAEAMKNAFKGIPAIADESVGKITKALDELDQAMSDRSAGIGLTTKQVQAYEAAAAAITEQMNAVQALKDAETARYKAEQSNLDHLKDAEAKVAAQSKAAAEARIAEINKSVQSQRELVNDIETQIKAEKRLENARAKRSNKRQQDLLDLGVARSELAAQIDSIQKGGDIGPTPGSDRLKALDAEIAELDKLIGRKEKSQALDDKKSAESKKRLQELAARREAASPEVAQADAEIQAVRDQAAVAKATGDARIKAQQELTAATKTETAKRIDELNKELAAHRTARNAENQNVRSGKRSLASMTAAQQRSAAERAQLERIRDQAVALRDSVADPMAMRRVARTLPGGADTQARGMAALTEQTRRAADAQRLLNGEVKTGNSGFNSANSYVLGLVSAYTLYATAITQASKAIDAYKAKESFQITVSNTLGGDRAKAAGEFDYLTDAANKYGFAIASISQEYAKLAATARGIGRSDKDIRALFEGVLSVGRVNALSDEKMQDAFRAVTQILSKNQVMSEELKGQLAEALPGAVVGFAQSQGYGPDQMKAFAKDLEAGKFAARDIIEYAQKELEENANAVLRAQSTFQATMARFQNTLFKSRADFAENGFMDELTQTIRELDEFFKSDDGKAYLIRLGEGAQVAVSALATVAKNLDVIISALGVVAMAWGGSKVSKIFAGMAAGAASAAQGVTATGVAATRAAKGVAVLGAGLRGLMGLMGGIPGIALMMAGALWSYTSSQNAEKAAEAQSRLDRIRDVIGEIRTAAVDAEGDVAKFVKGLAAIKGMTGTQQMELRRDVVQAKEDVRQEMTNVIHEAFITENGRWEYAKNKGLDGVLTLGNDGDTARLNRIVTQIGKGGFDRKAVNAELDAIAKANPAMTEYVVRLQAAVAQMVELEGAQRDVGEAIDAANGKTETAEGQMKRHTTENRNATEAATLAAEAQKKFEESLDKTGQTAADGADGHKEYADAIKAADKFREESIKLLKEWIEQEKLAGKAIPADEIARQTRRISDAFSAMTRSAERDLRQFQLAAQGLSVELDDVSNSMLAAYQQQEQFGQTQLDPLGTVTGSGRKYGSDKRSIAEGIVDTATALGISPEDLATVISYETAGTFDPLKRGPTTQHGQHRGLIQFGVPQAAQHGVNWNDPVNSQLGPNGAVAKYLRNAGVRPGMGILDIYSAINAGRVGRYNASDANNGGAPGTVRDKVEKQMGGHRANARSLLGDYASGSSQQTSAPTYQDRVLGAHTAQNVSTALSDAAKNIVVQATIDNPDLFKDVEFAIAYNEGNAKAVADLLRKAGDDARADEVLRLSVGQDMVRQTEATIEAANAFKEAADKISFDADDLKAGNRKAAVDRETADLIKELTQDGADLAAATGAATRQEAEALVRARVERQQSVELAKQQRELAADSAESTAQSLRDDQQRIEVQRILESQGERAAELARIHNELKNEDEDRGYSRSDAERNEIANLRIKAWDAENAERLANEAKDKAEKSRDEAEKVHTDKIKTLQDKLAYLNDQLAVAIENRDATTQNRLKDEIRGVSDELITATQAAEQFYGTLSGPEGEQGVLAMQRLRLEAERSAAEMGQMSPQAQEIAAVIENSLNGAVSTFAEKVASGMSVWDALKSTVAQAIGEILVNIGRMITQAVIANSVMSALGLPSQYATPAANAATAANGGPLTSIVGFLGGLTGGLFHDGGVIGDPSKNIDFLAALMNLKPGERPIIAEDGEEMLTRRDPRHRDNMGAAIARFHRFHTGGIIGSVPDPAGSALSSGAAGRAMTAAAAQAAAPATPGNVTVINALDEQDIVDRALSTPAGERLIMNVFAKNKSKFKGMMG